MLILQVQNELEMIAREVPAERSLIFAAIFAAVIIIIFIKLYYKTPVVEIVKTAINSFFKKTATRQEPGKSNVNLKSILFFANLVFVINFTTLIFSFLIYSYDKDIPLINSGIELYAAIFASVVLYLGFKVVTIRLLAWVLDSNRTAAEYLFVTFSNFRAVGILLLPINILYPFVDEYSRIGLIIISLTLIFAGFLIRIIKGFLISFEIKFRFLYSILYFCTLEIFPLLIILEILSRI